LSFYAYLYPFIKKYLEPLLPKNIRYNTWSIENMPSITDKTMIQKINNIDILKDKRTIVILINPETKFSITL
jgi:hypothetical protein